MDRDAWQWGRKESDMTEGMIWTNWNEDKNIMLIENYYKIQSQYKTQILLGYISYQSTDHQ